MDISLLTKMRYVLFEINSIKRKVNILLNLITLFSQLVLTSLGGLRGGVFFAKTKRAKKIWLDNLNKVTI